jgi:hypothetical protein
MAPPPPRAFNWRRMSMVASRGTAMKVASGACGKSAIEV